MFNNDFFSTGFGVVALSAVVAYLPRVLVAVAVLIVGAVLAKYVRKVLVKFLGALNLGKLVEKTPLGDFMQQNQVGQRLVDLLGALAYWALLILALYLAASVLGLASVVYLFNKMFELMPSVISAGVVMIVGVILAGVVESFVKSSFKTITGRSTLIVGKISSYGILVLTVLMALSELGIARDFILILFVGFVATFSLAIGLAVGLGSQHLVKSLLEDWYKNTK